MYRFVRFEAFDIRFTLPPAGSIASFGQTGLQFATGAAAPIITGRGGHDRGDRRPCQIKDSVSPMMDQQIDLCQINSSIPAPTD